MDQARDPAGRSYRAGDTPAEALTCVLDPTAYLGHREAAVRRDAVELLRWLGRTGDFEAFVRAALDRDPEVRAAAALALARCRPDGAGRERLRYIAEGIGPEAERAAETLAVLDGIDASAPAEPRPSGSPQRDSRILHLLRLLGHVGSFEALEVIRPYATSDTDALRAAAAEGLGRLGFETAVPTLLALTHDTEDGVREAAAAALARIRRAEAPELPPIDPTPADGGGAARLHLIAGPCEGRDFPLPHPVSVVGRAPDAHIRIPDPWLSRHHAEVSLRAGGSRIRDLASTNGTFVNGTDTDDSVLCDGDHIVIGETVLIFRVGGR